MGTDAVLSGASQRADAHHRRFSRSPRLASLILSSSLRLPPIPLPHALLATISPSPSSNSRVARRRPSASPCRLFGYVWPLRLPVKGASPRCVVSAFAALVCARPCTFFFLLGCPFSLLFFSLSLSLFIRSFFFCLSFSLSIIYLSLFLSLSLFLFSISFFSSFRCSTHSFSCVSSRSFRSKDLPNCRDFRANERKNMRARDRSR